jgi:hypothetical protein
MRRIADILRNTEFISSSSKTQQFMDFTKTFRTEFEKEMKEVGATDIQFNIGHFYISGFFNVGEKLFYFNLSDVRGMNYKPFVSLLYRTAKNRQDFTGGQNMYVTIGESMAKGMWL